MGNEYKYDVRRTTVMYWIFVFLFDLFRQCSEITVILIRSDMFFLFWALAFARSKWLLLFITLQLNGILAQLDVYLCRAILTLYIHTTNERSCKYRLHGLCSKNELICLLHPMRYIQLRFSIFLCKNTSLKYYTS